MTDDLTPAEVVSLTQKKRADQQAATLAKMGVPFRFGGGIVSVRRAVAQELPQWLAKMPKPAASVTLEPSQLPQGLLDWQAERRAAFRRRETDAHDYRQKIKAGSQRRAAACARATGAQRRAALRNQVPPWASMSDILAIYQQAAALTASTGVVHHVDHLLPLRGRLVSGFHVASNLAVVPASENLRKSNKFTPS